MVSASEDSTPSIIYHCVLRGLERLLLSEQLSRVDGEALVKLSVDRVNMPSPHRAMAALGLMLTCMYTGKRSTNKNPVHLTPTGTATVWPTDLHGSFVTVVNCFLTVFKGAEQLFVAVLCWRHVTFPLHSVTFLPCMIHNKIQWCPSCKVTRPPPPL